MRKHCSDVLKTTLAALILGSLIACSSAGKNSTEFSFRENSFQKTVTQWTRQGKIYSDLDTIMLVDALYQSWTVRQQYIEVYTSQNLLSEEAETKLYNEFKEKDQNTVEFLVAVYTSDPNWNDLEKKNSIWNLYLETPDGTRNSPSSVKKMTQREIPLKRFYPFITVWRTVYIVEFPKKEAAAEDTHDISLIVSGMLGTARLAWGMKG